MGGFQLRIEPSFLLLTIGTFTRIKVNLPWASPGASEGKLFNFISRACRHDSSRRDSKEKANRSLTQPYAGLAGPFPPAASSGVPWVFPMDDLSSGLEIPVKIAVLNIVLDHIGFPYQIQTSVPPEEIGCFMVCLGVDFPSFEDQIKIFERVQIEPFSKLSKLNINKNRLTGMPSSTFMHKYMENGRFSPVLP